MKKLALVCLVNLFLGFTQVHGQATQENNIDFSGLVYSDLYWNIQHHSEQVDGANGYRFRRIYFTADSDLSDNFLARFRLEAKSPGDYETNARLTPFVKDAYLQWRTGSHRLQAGLAQTPAFDFIEEVWGYRSVQKSPLDLQKMMSSREIGLAGKGDFGSNKWGYHLMLGNGNGSKAELNKGKKVMGSLFYSLNENTILQTYADYTDRDAESYSYTLQGFTGYNADLISVGILYAHQHTNEDEIFGDFNLRIASIFGRFELDKQLTGILRMDHMWDANPRAAEISYVPMSNFASSTLLIAGMDWQLHEKVHLIPNAEMVFYDNETIQDPENNVTLKATLFFSF